MNLQVTYCNHKSANLSVRERLAISTEGDLRRAYAELKQRFPRSESVVLSTCNRVEVYTAQENPGDAPTQQDVARFFAEFHNVPLTDFFDELLEQSGPDAVRHLFEVAGSIDSLVLGESQIVNQVKSAYEQASASRANGPLTNALFQRALQVSARIRRETKLAEGRVSIASVAVGEFGRSIFDRFTDKTVLVIGSGEMAEETLRYLADEGVGRMYVCNRSLPRAQELAGRFHGEARPWEELPQWLGEADIVVAATGATQPVVTRSQMADVRRKTGERPLFILDLGAPRDFEPGIADLDDGVFLYNVDDLTATCERNRRLRIDEIRQAHTIIDEETADFMQAVYHQATGPIVKRLREEWHTIGRGEIDQLFQKLPHLQGAERAAIERCVERIVNKLLHPPLQTIRDEAREGTPHSLLDAIRRLFHLGD
jgi:glutamyl-tRNA reductase